MAHNTLHVIGAQCVARDFHTIVPWPLERTCWRQFAAQRADCKKSQTTPLNAIIIIIVIVIIIIIIIITIIISSSNYVYAEVKSKVVVIFCLLHNYPFSCTRGRYHGGRRPSSFHSPTVIPPSALNKPSITKSYHRRRTCSHLVVRRRW